jgi:hypothetical protein
MSENKDDLCACGCENNSSRHIANGIRSHFKLHLFDVTNKKGEIVGYEWRDVNCEFCKRIKRRNIIRKAERKLGRCWGKSDRQMKIEAKYKSILSNRIAK